MLQGQKLLKLEEVEVKAEEEPKEEVIVGSSGEVLRLPGTGNTFHRDKFLLRSSVFGQQPPSSLSILEALLDVR